MSIKLMTLAFQTPYKPTPKLILLALCDFSNDKGISYPSLSTLMEKCTVGKTNLTYVLRAFESINLLKKEKRKRENGSDTSTMYYIQIRKLNTLATIDEKFEDYTLAKKEHYIVEFETAYKRCKGSLSEHPKVHLVNTIKNHSVNTPVHYGEHLEPSYNHHITIKKRYLKISLLLREENLLMISKKELSISTQDYLWSMVRSSFYHPH